MKGGAGPFTHAPIATARGEAPTVVFFHGGGWVAGDLETHDRQARNLVIETGAVVVSVDYRRPPETRFPGAFEDAFAATSDIFGRVPEFGGDASASASPATAPAAISQPPPRSPAAMPVSAGGQLLVYPVTDVSGNSLMRRERALSFARGECRRLFPHTRTMEWFCGHYLEDPAHGADWRVSPLRAEELKGVAPAVVTTAWFDPLRDEGAAYARALQAAGVPRQVSSGPRPDPRLFRSGRRFRSRARRSATRTGRFQDTARARNLNRR